jgi:hypothetical protein
MHVNIAIQKFLRGGMIEVSPTQNKDYLSNFFTLQEQTKHRPILDCQKLNSFIQVEHFKMEGVPALRDLIEKNDYICKIDLKDAYVVIPIHPDSQDYLSFENQGTIYRYKSLAFGLSIAPRVFSKIMKYALEPLRKEGHRLIYYLDDICLLEKMKAKMNILTTRVTQHLQNLGFIINYNEYTKSNEDTRISWIPIQYQDDGDFSAQFKDQQSVEENMTSGDSPKEIMQMDCKFTGKDDSYDSGSGRRATSHKVHSEGLITSSTTIEPELGNDMQLVLYRPPRHRMVEDIHYEEEWVTHSKDKTVDTKGNHTRGCIEHRLGNQFSVGNNIRILDDGRNATFNKRKRAQDDSVCDTTPRKRLCKLNYKDFLGQPDGLEVHDKVRRNSISITTGFSNQDTESLQHTQHSRQLSTRTGYTEYGSRQIEQSQETPVRINNPETNVQTNHSPMGTATSGCLCSKTQSTITVILGTEPGPRSSCTGCISTRLASQWVVPLPILETNSSSYTEDKTTATEESSSNHTTLAKSILVSNDIANETFETTNSMETEFKMVFSRMAVINDYRKENGIGQEAMEYLNQKIRQSTQRAYDNGWNHWVTWCISNKKDPCHYDPKDVLSFLLENQKYSSTHLNTLRSAIASVFTIIHPPEKPIADQPLIKDFFSAKRRSEVKIPSQQQLFTWDITILLQYIKTKLSPTKDITLQELQVKTILLLCVATMWRPRSDIGQLQHRDINITQDQQGKYRAIIHARAPKESQVKSTILGEYIEDTLCPVRTLQQFLEKTTTLRTTLPPDHTLFLTYLDKDDKQSSSVRPTTVANWIKAAFKEAGIDTTHFQAHSIRSAASTKAVELGHSIQDVKKHADWSLTSNTFEKFYYKPSSQLSSSSTIDDSFFSATDNSITLEVGVESTGISLGTTSNTNVDETKTENVIHTRPWYRYFW